MSRGSTSSGSNTQQPLVYTAPRRSGWFHRLITLLVVAVVIHYLLWWPAALILLTLGYFYAGGSYWYLTALAIGGALYARSFFDNSQFKLGRAWDWFRMHWFWKYGHEYLNLRMIRTAALDAGKQYIFGWHPHGILILSRLAVYGGVFEQFFPGVEARTLGATPMFYWPGAREVSLWNGAVDAGAKSAERVLKAGMSLIVYPGGSREIFKTDERSTDTELELSHRRGFVRLAMAHGTPLVPVVVYNERSAYTRVTPPEWLRNFCLKRLKVPAVLLYGRFFSLVPRKCSLGVVFGKPMAVPHIPDIQKEDPRIDEVLQQYIKELTALWEQYKGEFGYGANERLVIV